MDNCKVTFNKLTYLINSIKGGKIYKENKTSILEYILFPELLNFDKMKEKIYIILAGINLIKKRIL